MTVLLALLITSTIQPDLNLEVGYGRILKTGKPSSEIVRLRAGLGCSNQVWKISGGLSFTVPTTMPASVGIQAAIDHLFNSLWAQSEFFKTRQDYGLMTAVGWSMFGMEGQYYFSDKKVFLIKLSIPLGWLLFKN